MERKHYKHLTFTKRLQLEALLKIKTPKKDIAKILDVHISTIYREVKRGRYEHLNGATWMTKERYSPDIADEKYRENLAAKGVPIKLGNDYELAAYIEKRICDDKLSPSAVLGEIRHKGLNFKTTLSVNTLYSYIEKGVFYRLSLQNLLRKSVKKRTKREVKVSRPPKGTSIEQRPKDIAKRNSFGHWEMDCVCGPTKTTLLMLTERLTRKEIMFKMPNQKAESVIRCLNVLERRFGKNFRKVFKSITVDNGSEFSAFNEMERSRYGGKRTNIFYCHPYSAYERGTNERLNREVRRLVPKGFDLSKLSDQDVAYIEKWVNDYPRRILDYASSEETFNQYMRAI